MSIEIGMVDPWGQVVRECEAGNLPQRSVAMTYAFGLRQTPPDQLGLAAHPGIVAAHEAIIKRWNVKALDRIKARAWDYVTGRQEFGT